MATLRLGAFVTMLAVLLSGCTGQFEVEQTEPIQVQLEGEPERVSVREGEEPQRIVVENPDKVERVDVEVEVTSLSDGPVTVFVQVKDEETDEVLVEKEITTEFDENETADEPADNETEEPETTSGDTTIEIIQVDVRGKDNFVVLTDAKQGDADINIAARGASSDETTIEGNQTTE